MVINNLVLLLHFHLSTPRIIWCLSFSQEHNISFSATTAIWWLQLCDEQHIKLIKMSHFQNTVDNMAVTALPSEFWLRERLKQFCQLSGHHGGLSRKWFIFKVNSYSCTIRLPSLCYICKYSLPTIHTYNYRRFNCTQTCYAQLFSRNDALSHLSCNWNDGSYMNI